MTRDNLGPVAVSSATTLGLSHFAQTIETTGTTTLTLSDAATLLAGWYVWVANTGVATVTLARATSGDTINGTAANVTVRPGNRVFVQVNAAANGFITVRSYEDLILDRDVTVNEVVNSIAETTVYTYSVPAGSLSTNRRIQLTLVGDYLNNSGAGAQLTIRTKFGATTILSYDEAAIATNALRRPMMLEAFLDAANATGAQVAYGRLRRGQPNGITGTMSYDEANTHTSGINTGVAEDSTLAKTLSVTVQHSVAATTISFRAHTVFVKLI